MSPSDFSNSHILVTADDSALYVEAEIVAVPSNRQMLMKVSF